MFLAASMVLCLASSAPAATYYIDWSSGADSNNGTTTSTAWKSAPSQNSFSGTYSPTAGDRFIFKGGVTWPTNIAPWVIYNAYHGSPGTNTYFGVDKNWFSGSAWTRPVFDGGSQYPIMSSIAYGYLEIDASYVTIDNLTLQNIGVAGTNQGNYAINLSNCHDITIQNCYLHVMSRVAIEFGIATGGTVGNFEICSNDISACSWGLGGGAGAATAVTNVWIHDNTFHDFHPQLTAEVHGDGIFFFVGDATDTNSYFDNLRIYRNYFYGDFTDQAGANSMSAFIWPTISAAGTAYVYNNVITYERTGGNGAAYAIGVGAGARGQIYVFNNSFYGDSNSISFLNGGGGTNLTVMNNLFSGAHTAYVIQWPPAQFVSDYNNFFNWTLAFAFNVSYEDFTNSGPITSITVNNPGAGYTVGSVIAVTYGVEAKAVVTSTNSSGGVTGLNLTSGGFGYKANWPGLTALVSGTGSGLTVGSTVPVPSGFEAHGLTSNPQFVSLTDLHVQTNSPAIGAGTNLTAFASVHGLTELLVDYAGNARPTTGNWTIGAYEASAKSLGSRYIIAPRGLTVVAK